MPTPSQEISLLEFLILLPQGGVVFWIKIIFILASFLLFGGIVWLLFHTSWFKEHYGQNLADFILGPLHKKGRQERQWRKIKAKAESEKEAERKLAIIEAEEFLDNFLKQRKLPGANLRERFRALVEKEILSAKLYQELTLASQIVDDIIQDPDFKLDKSKARETVAKFEQVIQNLAAFDI